MKKTYFSGFGVLLLVLLLSFPAMAWQGRMAGAGDVTGLVEDESDYLVHPAAIASGKGFNAYGSYRLTYEKTNPWDYKLTDVRKGYTFPMSASGPSWKSEALLGAAFKVGAGRMGVFFQYDRVRGKYDGQEIYEEISYFELEDQSDNFKLRLLYGLPVGSALNVGGELAVAYIKEEKRTQMFWPGLGTLENYPWGAEGDLDESLYAYMIPYKSKYWEAQGKVSVDGKIGGVKYAVTLKGGLPFASDNEYTHSYDTVIEAERTGKVKGFNVGGDVWFRVPLSSTVALPFVVGAGYQEIKRDGSGVEIDGPLVNSGHEEKNLSVRAGGGVDITPAQGTRVAAGLYYDFISVQQNIYQDYTCEDGSCYYYDDYTDMPASKEHRLTLKAMMEQDLGSKITVRGGFNVFYGLAQSDYGFGSQYWSGGYDFYGPFDISTSGTNMGLNASVGMTLKLGAVSLEPFFNGGISKYQTSGYGTYFIYPMRLEVDKSNWHLGGGLSVRF